MPEWLTALTVGEVIAWVAGAAGLYAAIKRAYPFVRRVVHFLDDLMGEPDRPGAPGRPGVLARLTEHEDAIKQIRHEVLPNHGSSLKDAVNRIEAQQRDDSRTRQVIKEAVDATNFVLTAHVQEAIRSEDRIVSSIIKDGPARIERLERIVEEKL